jgi:hypothetical protein
MFHLQMLQFVLCVLVGQQPNTKKTNAAINHLD